MAEQVQGADKSVRFVADPGGLERGGSPGEYDDFFLPVHVLDLVETGMPQGQNFHMEALAEECVSDGVYTFLLEASPEPFVAAVGAPTNPIAIR